MTENIHKVHPPALKTRVVLDAIREVKTMAELSSEYGIHTTQIRRWKEKAFGALNSCFSEVGVVKEKNQEELIQNLYQEIGRLKIELDWLKKKMGIIESR